MRAAAKIATFILFPVLAIAQGGPPFQSDDPDTPGNGHVEINVGFAGERTPLGSSYDAPNFDFNYGVGNRIQLKFEVPISIQEMQGTGSNHSTGLGNSIVGVKYRFHERHSQTHTRDGEPEVRFSTSVYPQLILTNASRSVASAIGERAPQFLLPLEANAEIRWLRVSAEAGYWFKGKEVPNRWIRGAVVGHEFQKDKELYLELYDAQDTRPPAGIPRLRETTFGVGGRFPIVRGNWLRLLGLVGHGIVTATPANGQPGWIAYAGIQFLSEGRRRHGDVP